MFLHDRLSITSKRTYTDEGFMIVPSRIARAGIQEYFAGEMGLTDRDPTDIIRVYRPPEEVFSEESLSSFSNKPVTNNHPPELVDASNFKKYAVGHSGIEVIKDGDYVKVDLTINDLKSIKDIESGKAELSNGYTSDIEWIEGISPQGEHYDCIQRNIKGNHIAIVERGRAGFNCRVADNLPQKGAEANMAKVTIDGVDYEGDNQIVQAVTKLQRNLKDAEEDLSDKDQELKDKEDEMEKDKKDAKAKEDSLHAEIDDAKSKILTADSLDKLVAERATLLDSVRKLVPDIKVTGKDADTLRKEVVIAKCENVNLDSVSADYIRARFDMLSESIDNNSQHNLDEAFTKIVTKDVTKDENGKVIDTRPIGVISRDKFMEYSQNAWKPKGAAS